jgi:uncharacterized protein YbaR (Trm112 family)
MFIDKINKKSDIEDNQKPNNIKLLLQFLRCPHCKKNNKEQELFYDENNQQLICSQSKLAFPIIDNIPIMLIDKAKKID